MGSFENHVRFLRGMHPRVVACSHHAGHWEHGAVGSAASAKTGPPEGRGESFEAIAPGCLTIDLDAAAVEYCRLFVLRGGVAAVASAWLPGNDPNRAAPIVGLVHNLQQALGLELPAALPPDHAGLLLPLMAWLLDHQPAAASDFRAAALSPWLARFAAALGERAQLPFYRATAAILEAI